MNGVHRRRRSGGRGWLVLFTDLAMILLAFFVMLYAMSEPEPAQWEKVVSALSQREATAPRPDVVGPSTEYTVDVAPTERHLAAGYLESVVADLAQETPALSALTVERRNDRLYLSLPSDLLFATGRAELSDPGSAALARLADILGNVDNPIEVHGHADPRPIQGGDYANNWELSLTRALAVAAGLRQNGLAKPLRPRGFADARSSLVAPGGPQADRFALMRRVDIVVLGEARAP